MPKWFKHSIFIALTVLVGGLILNNVLFMHIHLLPDGEIVVHAHPFSNGHKTSEPVNQHEHSDSEYNFFDSLLLLFSANVLLPIAKEHNLLQRVVPVNAEPFLSYSGNQFAQRAPPLG